MGIRRIILEGDAQNLCISLSQNELDNGINDVIVNEAKHLMVLGFDDDV